MKTQCGVDGQNGVNGLLREVSRCMAATYKLKDQPACKMRENCADDGAGKIFQNIARIFAIHVNIFYHKKTPHSLCAVRRGYLKTNMLLFPLDDIAVFALPECFQAQRMVHVVEINIRIDRLPVDASFKMKVRCRGTPRLSGQCNHLSGFHAVADIHHVLRVMTVISFQPVSMLDALQT